MLVFPHCPSLSLLLLPVWNKKCQPVKWLLSVQYVVCYSQESNRQFICYLTIYSILVVLILRLNYGMLTSTYIAHRAYFTYSQYTVSYNNIKNSLFLRNNVEAIFILYDWLLHSFSRQCPKAGTRAWRHVVCIRTNSALSVDLEAELWTRLFRYPLPIRLTLPLLTLPQRKSEKTTLDLSGMAFVI